MNRVLGSAVALMLLTGAALAQADAPPPPAPAPTGMKAPPPPGGPAAMDDGPGGPPVGPRGHRPPPSSRAGHIRLQRGDTMLDIQCAEDEPMKTCADLAIQMLDKLPTLPRP